MYYLAAELTLIVHFVFIIFVIFGGLFFFISKKILLFHFPALIWGIYIELTHTLCPLTYLENWFLEKANLIRYSEGFILHHIVPIVYPTVLTEELQIRLAIALILINIVIYGFIISKHKKKIPPIKHTSGK